MRTYQKSSIRRTITTLVRSVQRAPEAHKKRIVIVSSVVASACVVTLWVLLFNTTVGSIGKTEVLQTSAAPSTKQGVGERFSDGFAAIIGSVKESYAKARTYTGQQTRMLESLIESPREISIENTAPIKP